MPNSFSPLLPEKEFFSMGEACRLVQVPDYTLRYWETKLRLVRPVRRESGHRRYAHKDIKTLLRVKELVQNRHMSLAGARQILNREQRMAHRIFGEPAGDASQINRSDNAAVIKALRDLRSEIKTLLDEFE